MNKIFTHEDAEKLSGDHIVIPDGHTEIGDGAFKERYSIESITLPPSLERVGVAAFVDCHNLNKIIVDDNSKFKEKIAVFEEFEVKLSRGGIGAPALVLMRFRENCHEYIFSELSTELMREMLSFVFAPFLSGYTTSIADRIELTPELYYEMKELYTEAYNSGIASLEDIQGASHPVIPFAIKIAIRAGEKYLGGKEIIGKGHYRCRMGKNILCARESVEKHECKAKTRDGYNFIKDVLEAMCDGMEGTFPPSLFDYQLREYRRKLPDYKLSVFELRMDKVCELHRIALREGIEELKQYTNDVVFLDHALGEYFRDEYTADDSNYEEYDMLGRLYQPTKETREKMVKAFESHCQVAIAKATSKEETALLQLTRDGIKFIIEGENPMRTREYLEFVYGVFWNDAMTWDTSDDALIAHAAEVRRLCDIARRKGLFEMMDEVNRKDDIFLRFAVNQLIYGAANKDCLHSALNKRIENELLCGKTADEVRLLKLTAESIVRMLE